MSGPSHNDISCRRHTDGLEWRPTAYRKRTVGMPAVHPKASFPVVTPTPWDQPYTSSISARNKGKI
jgi:hypothetical protein